MVSTVPAVLIIHEGDATRSALESLLTSNDCRAVRATTSEEALRSFATQRIDLVIQQFDDDLDPKSDLDGVALTQAMRACVPSLPFIFLTPSKDHTAVTSFVGTCGIEWLATPWKSGCILAAVRRLLQGRTAGRSRTQYETGSVQ